MPSKEQMLFRVRENSTMDLVYDEIMAEDRVVDRNLIRVSYAARKEIVTKK